MERATRPRLAAAWWMAAVAVIMSSGVARAAPLSAAAVWSRVNISDGACISAPTGSSFCYAPNSITIRSGDAITWHTVSRLPHTATSCTPDACPGEPAPPAAFDTGIIPGLDVSRPVTFTTPGTYVYYCTQHGYAAMHATVTVSSASGASAAARPVTPPAGTPSSGPIAPRTSRPAI